MIWRWRRQRPRRRSDLLCLGCVWAAPWTGCCHAASSHLDVVRAALRKSLRLHLRVQLSQVTLYARVYVFMFVSHPRLRHRFGLHSLPVRVVFVLCTLALYIVYYICTIWYRGVRTCIVYKFMRLFGNHVTCIASPDPQKSWLESRATTTTSAPCVRPLTLDIYSL